MLKMTIKKTIYNYLRLINNWIISVLFKQKKSWLIILLLLFGITISSIGLNIKMVKNLVAQSNVENDEENPVKKKK
jgi:hypothetical protein